MTSENIFKNPPANPFPIFEAWYDQAKQSEPNDPNAMTLATTDANGFPHARIVLLKDLSEDKGFGFFTNTRSHKGQQLRESDRAALCFHWKSLRKQVRVEGIVTPTTNEAADAYFASRSRGSQLGAWASQQSESYADKSELENALEDVTKKFEGQDVTRPPHWSGYNIAPLRIELWQDGDFRLHDRLVYVRQDLNSPWQTELLYP